MNRFMEEWNVPSGRIGKFLRGSIILNKRGDIITDKAYISRIVYGLVRKGHFEIIAETPNRVIQLTSLTGVRRLDGRPEPYEANFINEGLIINKFNKIVSFDPSNEDFVNMSLKDNPRKQSGEYGDGVDVYSIFQRNFGRSKNITNDGNPLVYAFKEEGGWKFRHISDRKAIIERMEAISRKFIEEHEYDVVIVLPSSRGLNRIIAETFAKVYREVRGKEITVIYEKVFRKATISEIVDAITAKGSEFRKRFGKNAERRFRELEEYFEDMKRVSSVKRYEEIPFRSHLIPKSDLRDIISDTIRADKNNVKLYNKYIDGKDVLFIDDTIRKGLSIKSAAKSLKIYYNPRSINVLTMFSRL